ncbi:MAG TPA: hypothetical protein VJP80_07820 [Candidatus Saccharimonadales bacterium]|nr:hypothetical protein [Candidatus Saccharimonadales bacterium]
MRLYISPGLNTLAATYGSGTYDSCTYNCATTSGSASSGSLANTGIAVAAVVTIAAVMLLATVLVRFWHRPEKPQQPAAQEVTVDEEDEVEDPPQSQ